MTEQTNKSVSPSHIAVHQKARQFEIHFNDGSKYNLPCEYLRVFSPSAEVRAAKNRGELIQGKQQVNIDNVEPMGSYAIRILFDDGHDTGVYSWSTLKNLADNFDSNWGNYQKQIDDFQKINKEGGTVSILFFISLVETLGTEKLEMDLSDEVQLVSDIIQKLTEKGDEWSEALKAERLTITVNKQFTTVDQKLFNGDEIAFVPKV